MNQDDIQHLIKTDFNDPQIQYVTVSCPIKKMQQRYIVKGCKNCEHCKGFGRLTDSEFDIKKDSDTGEIISKRPLAWHEKYLIRCTYPMARRCANMAIVEE